MWKVILGSFWLRRPFVVATWIYVIIYSNRFDDTKFVAVLASVIIIFISDYLGLQGHLKEIVAKGLETAGKLKGTPSGDN